MPKISVFTSAKEVTPQGELDLDTYLIYIRDGYWQDPVLQYRAQRIEKTAVPAVTASGNFSKRNAAGIIQHSGVIALDFDAKDNEYFPADEIAPDPFVHAMHRSLGGSGWAVYVKIEPERHLDAYFALEKYFADKYQVIADKSCKDVSRLRFVSYDPDLHYAPSSKQFKKYIPKAKQMPTFTPVYSDSDIDYIMTQVRQRGVSLLEDYHDWVTIAFALAREMGESGRTYFHELSSYSAKYDSIKTDKKYDNALRTHSGRVGIASLFWLCQQNGIETKTQRTRHIENTAVIHKKKAGQNGGSVTLDSAKDEVKRVLVELDNIQGVDVDKIIEQVFAIPDDQLPKEKQEDILPRLIGFVRTYPLRYNEVTQFIELSGGQLTDREFNSILITAKKMLGDSKVGKDLLYSIIDSDLTPSFHPFTEWFTKRANLKPKGLINEFLSCITIKVTGMSEQEYKERFIKKWLLSVCASAFGTYSVMCLVLTGGQGVSKTKFFRNLLPEDLRKYYADNKLDNMNKDDIALLCSMLIICDDEFGGKSKKDYKMFKETISKDKIFIRKPYGRMVEERRRYAVLCGTSNEEEIINDPTGNRRIIPVNVTDINFERMEKIDREALWMELYHEWKQIGDGWMLSREDISALQAVTVGNEEATVEVEAVAQFFRKHEIDEHACWLTNTQIKDYIESRTQQRLSTKRLGLALKQLGYLKVAKKINGATVQVYPVVKTVEEQPQNPF